MWRCVGLTLTSLAVLAGPIGRGEAAEIPAALDQQVRSFLESRQGQWRDWNVPARDGQFLHDMIVEHGYKRALEIGTSTGYSTIWIAWAMAKTGGEVITLEIDPGRHAEAVENLREAGLADYVDARLGDAHELVKTLDGPFDFVFSDADKNWYRQYFVDVAPKMPAGGCYTSHNIRMRGMRDYVAYLNSRPEFDNRIENDRTSGIAITCRKPD